MASASAARSSGLLFAASRPLSNVEFDQVRVVGTYRTACSLAAFFSSTPLLLRSPASDTHRSWYGQRTSPYAAPMTCMPMNASLPARPPSALRMTAASVSVAAPAPPPKGRSVSSMVRYWLGKFVPLNSPCVMVPSATMSCQMPRNRSCMLCLTCDDLPRKCPWSFFANDTSPRRPPCLSSSARLARMIFQSSNAASMKAVCSGVPGSAMAECSTVGSCTGSFRSQ
mmetsp:Transcript_36781/g.71791  ORF Transcript_36781/g.71791 Transcript_36781/m.71791 type:complete len:226 (-) Transcript_36781:608-1285(-)